MRKTHHHADVRLGLVVHRVVQHQVHELVETPQRAGHVPVGVERDCAHSMQREVRTGPRCRPGAQARRGKRKASGDSRTEHSFARPKSSGTESKWCWSLRGETGGGVGRALTAELLVHEPLQLGGLNLRHVAAACRSGPLRTRSATAAEVASLVVRNLSRIRLGKRLRGSELFVCADRVLFDASSGLTRPSTASCQTCACALFRRRKADGARNRCSLLVEQYLLHHELDNAVSPIAMPGPTSTMEIGGDGVAVIRLQNAPVNALHPDGEFHLTNAGSRDALPCPCQSDVCARCHVLRSQSRVSAGCCPHPRRALTQRSRNEERQRHSGVASHSCKSRRCMLLPSNPQRRLGPSGRESLSSLSLRRSNASA